MPSEILSEIITAAKRMKNKVYFRIRKRRFRSLKNLNFRDSSAKLFPTHTKQGKQFISLKSFMCCRCTTAKSRNFSKV